jgi:hypothetical protein
MEGVMSVDLGSSSTTSYQDDSNISIRKTMHLRDVDDIDPTASTDQLVSSALEHLEEVIASSDNPQLESSDPNVSNQPSQTAPTPSTTFMTNFQTAVANLTPQQLASLGTGTTMAEGQAKLMFAVNHPGVPLDSATQNLFNEVMEGAVGETQQDLDLPADWQPNLTTSAQADSSITRDMNQNFEALVRANLPPDEANEMIFEYYHPDDAGTENPQLAGFVSQALAETANEDGLPEGWQPAPDSSVYDLKLTMQYDTDFNEHLENDPETQNLTDEEKSELETMHEFPDEDVPDKASLEGIFSQLENEAQKDVHNQFNLPSNFTVAPNFTKYVAVVLGQYQSSFAANVKNMAPPLSAAQQQLLIATNGLSSTNLPLALQAAFNQIQGKTSDEIADMMGLPKNWLSSALSEEPAATGGEVGGEEGDVEDDGETAGSSSSSQATGSTTGNVGPGAFGAVLRKQIKQESSGALVGVNSNGTTILLQAALNAINLYQDAINTFFARSQQLGGSDWLPCGAFQANVNAALNNLRNAVYAAEIADSGAAERTNEATIDNQKAQELLNSQAEQASQTKAPKDVVSVIFQFLSFCPVLQKAVEQYVKLEFWCLDMLLGGALSAICQAAGIQPLGENPLEMAGWINAAQAAKMDMAVQIIVMVVEIVVEVLLAQPELVAGEIAMVAEDVSDLAVDVAVQVAAKSIMESAMEGGSDALLDVVVDSVTKSMSFGELATDAVEQVTETSVKEALQLQSKVEDALVKMTEQIGKIAKKEAVKAMREALEDAADKGLIKETKDEILAMGEDKIAQAFSKASDEVKEIAINKIAKGIEDLGSEEIAGVSGKISSGLKRYLKMALENKADFFKGVGRFLSDPKEWVSKVGKAVAKYFREALANKLLTFKQIGYLFTKSPELKAEIDALKNTILSLRVTSVDSLKTATTGAVHGALEGVAGAAAASKGLQVFQVVQSAVSGAMEGGAGIINGIKDENLASLKLLLADIEAEIAVLGGDLKVFQQLAAALLAAISSMGSWVNSINQQEASYYQKLAIRFIAA